MDPGQDPQGIKDRLAARARDLGFDRFGVASPELPPAHIERYQEWLAAGYHAGMDYMARTRSVRGDLEAILPGVRSVVCVLVDYRGIPAEPGPDRDPDPGPGGKVARYARGRDYHIVLKRRLERLADHLEEMVPGSRTRTCVDSVPVLERTLAWSAGLGFLGKNTLLITPGLGSYTLLAELLTTVELPVDRPIEGTCGRCTRCLDACPTSAFPEEGVLDSSRCISYLTIEHRGELPDEVSLDGWAFGCDVCQEVCPYNSGSSPQPPGEDFRTPRAAGAWLPASRLEGIPTREEFAARFGGTPLMRAGLEGLRRNLSRLRRDVIAV